MPAGYYRDAKDRTEHPSEEAGKKLPGRGVPWAEEEIVRGTREGRAFHSEGTAEAGGKKAKCRGSRKHTDG